MTVSGSRTGHAPHDDRFGNFKPREHNLLGSPIAETVFEPRVGGHIYDRALTAACAGGLACWPMSHRTGWCSAGTSDRNGRSRPTRTTRARSRSARSPRRLGSPALNLSIATSTGTAQAGGRRGTGVANDAGWPLYLARCAALVADGN